VRYFKYAGLWVWGDLTDVHDRVDIDCMDENIGGVGEGYVDIT
jgi:hypothetical protein